MLVHGGPNSAPVKCVLGHRNMACMGSHPFHKPRYHASTTIHTRLNEKAQATRRTLWWSMYAVLCSPTTLYCPSTPRHNDPHHVLRCATQLLTHIWRIVPLRTPCPSLARLLARHDFFYTSGPVCHSNTFILATLVVKAALHIVTPYGYRPMGLGRIFVGSLCSGVHGKLPGRWLLDVGSG